MSTILDRPQAPSPHADGEPRLRLRVRRSRVVAALVMAMGLAVAASWLLSWWSPVPVREVRVSGAAPDTAAAIESVAEIPLGTALRDIDAEAVAGRVAQLQGIDGVSLHLQRPWTVVIAVQERFPFAVAAAQDRWTVLDRSGRPIREVDKPPRRLPEVSGAPEQWSAAFDALAALDDHIRARAVSAAVDDDGGLVLTMRSGATVAWGRSERNDDKARVLAALLPFKASSYSVAVPERPAVSPDADLPEPPRKKNQRGAAPESAAATPDLE